MFFVNAEEVVGASEKNKHTSTRLRAPVAGYQSTHLLLAVSLFTIKEDLRFVRHVITTNRRPRNELSYYPIHTDTALCPITSVPDPDTNPATSSHSIPPQELQAL